MRLDDEAPSSNIEDRTGGGGRGGFGLPAAGLLGLVGSRFGCGGIIALVVVAMLLGLNPLQLLGDGQLTAPAPRQQQSAPAGGAASTIDPQVKDMVARVLGSTERRWTALFARSGERYVEPRLVLYTENDRSGCGAAQAAMGPFYCPADQRIYLDVTFFNELATRFRAQGDFAAAYVIAHEVGHHVQTLTGINEKVRRAQANASEAEGNALQVKMELQADCYAGVWARNDENLMEPGDLEEGLTAAAAIGDDTLQKAAGRRPVPESFTHGSAAQRVEWLRRGYQSGDPAACDTFAAGR
ncbi:KPN_02809 family neutral zinc metallopeptidase [Sphingomonas sanxanigenens]|uniref:Zinc metalloprotease n=1 Tax=Sphingomonas sanxanigenens DSM 19645 = NX02 TaxID=1123269 RepID=W0AE22_9SPHN|nr:neutral zinc metallopeptidase [Sphingomonas sanxanigenens]AHE56134.1 hypothetical protein NX02_22575 [Sphingomonas sanxanigenens DSM 19645 = NX02]